MRRFRALKWAITCASNRGQIRHGAQEFRSCNFANHDTLTLSRGSGSTATCSTGSQIIWRPGKASKIVCPKNRRPWKLTPEATKAAFKVSPKMSMTEFAMKSVSKSTVSQAINDAEGESKKCTKSPYWPKGKQTSESSEVGRCWMTSKSAEKGSFSSVMRRLLPSTLSSTSKMTMLCASRTPPRSSTTCPPPSTRPQSWCWVSWPQWETKCPSLVPHWLQAQCGGLLGNHEDQGHARGRQDHQEDF